MIDMSGYKKGAKEEKPETLPTKPAKEKREGKWYKCCRCFKEFKVTDAKIMKDGEKRCPVCLAPISWGSKEI